SRHESFERAPMDTPTPKLLRLGGSRNIRGAIDCRGLCLFKRIRSLARGKFLWGTDQRLCNEGGSATRASFTEYSCRYSRSRSRRRYSVDKQGLPSGVLI